LEEAILRENSPQSLGITTTPPNENKRNFSETGGTRGRKSNKQRIVEIGVKLIDSGQYPTIKSSLASFRKYF